MKLLSEVEVDEIVKMDDVIMQKNKNGEFNVAMPGMKLKSGKFPIDLHVSQATEEEFRSAIAQANHEDDWYSLLLKEVFLKKLDDRAKEEYAAMTYEIDPCPMCNCSPSDCKCK